jgi:L-lactate dehydrogenase complex protein LldE
VRPRIGFAALKLLESAGCEVIVPSTQTCCGQPGYNAGDFESARGLAMKLIAEFEGCEYVVVPSGSCAGMIRVHSPKLFENDSANRERVRKVAERCYELTDFLTRIVKLDKLSSTLGGALTYHDSCSGLRELGVCAQPRELLAKAGVRVAEMQNATTCCGFGGTFSVKFGDISSRMAERKCESIRQSGASCVAAGDLGCLLNIEGRLRREGDETTRVLHIAEVLAGNDAEWK